MSNWIVGPRMMSEHHCIHFGLNLCRPSNNSVDIERRRLSGIDTEVLVRKLGDDFNKSRNGEAPVLPVPDPNSLTYAYSDAVTEVLDKLAPIQKKTLTDQLEQRWVKSLLEIDLQVFKTDRKSFLRNIDTTKTTFHCSRIETAVSKQFFNVDVDDLIGGKKALTAVIPSNIPTNKLANAFSEFFDSLVREFRSHLPVP